MDGDDVLDGQGEGEELETAGGDAGGEGVDGDSGQDGTGEDAGVEQQEQGEEQAAEGSPKHGFTAEQQRIFDREIGRKVAKLKSAVDERDSARAEAAQLKADLEAARAPRDAEALAAAVNLGVHPDYLNASELQVLREYDALQAEEQSLLQDPDGDRAKMASVTMRLRRISPQAERLRMDRGAQMLEDMRLGREARKAGWKPGASAAAGGGGGTGRTAAAAGGGGRKSGPVDGKGAGGVPRPAVGAGGGQRARKGGQALVGARGGGRQAPEVNPENLRKAGGGRRGLISLYEKT